MLRFFMLCCLAAAFALAGCESPTDTEAQQQAADAQPEPAPVASGQAEIDWFDGSIDAAFAAARAEDKPLFFYWGAVWCPPCQEIKHTVFKSREFIQLTRLFVPVYLDGDTDRAQAWGEKFGVQGYPTMIVFNPAGDEVTRLPGGIEVDRYNDILELSLNQMKPTSELVQIALAEPGQLSAGELQQLAYYSWGQDFSAVPEGADTATMFHNLWQVASDDEISARFYLAYLLTLATDEGEEPADVLPGDDPGTQLRRILQDKSLTIAGWETLVYWSEEILALPALAEDTELAALWADAVFELRASDKLSKSEQLAGWLPRVLLATRDDAALSDGLASQLVAEMEKVDAATPDRFERQSVINQISFIYRMAGLEEQARNLLLAELEKSASPYYFMSGLASLAEQAEDFEQAIEWRRKAWEASTGQATRFQWGTNYVLALVRMAPDDQALIMSAADELLGSFEDPGQMFAGRNFKRLERLHRGLAEWQAGEEAAMLAFRQTIKSLCDSQESGSQAMQNCRSLLEDDESGKLARAS